MTLEKVLGTKARINLLPIQKGDVEKTWSNNHLYTQITKKKLHTPLETGIKKFVKWYKKYCSNLSLK